MNKFVLSAIALTTAGGLASAGTGSEEWLTLDREIESLASAQAATTTSTSGFTVDGFLRTSYVNSSDYSVPNEAGENDLGGFSIDNVRVDVTGTVGDYMLYVQLEGASLFGESGPTDGLLPYPIGAGYGTGGSVYVLDAYAAWNISDQFRLTMGQFRSPFLGTAQRNENELLFLDRTVVGHLWSQRDQGVMLSGQYDMLGWYIAGQNGIDTLGDDLSFSGRVSFDAMGAGTGGAGLEGAYGAAEGTNLSFGAGYYWDDDSVVDDLSAWNLEGTLVMGPLSAEASYVDHDDGFGTLLGLSSGPAILALTGGFMFVPDRWEAAVRWEDLDDDDDTSVITLGVNYYAVGHDAKWQLNYAMIDSDADEVDGDYLGIGLTVGV